MSTLETRKANCLLSQLYKSLNLERKYVKFTLDKVNNINHQIPASRYLELINSELIGDTILHLATKKNSSKYVDMILSRNVDFTIKNNNELTAIHQIIHQSKPLKIILNNELINSILIAHVQLNICTNPCDKNGISHFHAACMTNNAKAVEYFLNNDVSINQSINIDSSILPGSTPLHVAVHLCALETIEVLLNYGADMLIKDAKEMTPLDVLLEQKLKIVDCLNAEIEANLCSQQNSKRYCSYHQRIAKCDSTQRYFYKSAAEDSEIIDRIANLFLKNYYTFHRLDSTDEHFSSYLNIACTTNDQSMLELMLKEVTDVNLSICTKIKLCQGYTVLHFAAIFNVNTLKLLLKKGANIDITDSNGLTPFDICMEKYSLEEIQSIMSIIPAWKNIVLTDGQTHLIDFIYAMRDVNDFKTFLKDIGKRKDLCIPNDSPLWPGFTPLHIAVIFNKRVKGLHCSFDLKEKYHLLVKNCLDDEGFQITVQDANGWTPIHLAFRLNIDLLDLLFQNHRKLVNPMDRDGLTHLHIACLGEHQDLIKKFLSSNANYVNDVVNCTIKYKSIHKTLPFNENKTSINFINAGSTPLHNAVKNGNFEVAKLLLNYGADPYAKDIYDATPIHNEIVNDIRGNSILQLVSNLRDCVSIGGLSHLHVASYMKNIDAIEKLLNSGSDINARVSLPSDYDTQDPMYYLTKYNGFSALSFALLSSSLNVTSYLLQRDADILAIWNNEFTPIYVVLSGQRGNMAMFVKALEKDIATQSRMEKHSGITMLHVACTTIDVAMVEGLLRNGVDVNASAHLNSPIWPGCTPLHCLMNASNKGLFGGIIAKCVRRILKLLLENQADVTLSNAQLDTPLHLAYKMLRDNHAARDILLTMSRAHRNTLVNPVNRDGISHFHIACSLHDSETVEQFLNCNQNVDVNEPIDYFCDQLAGFTPLHLAISNNILSNDMDDLQTIQLLLDHGADVNAEDAWGNTPLHTAAKLDLLRVSSCTIIIDAGANLKAINILGETPLEIWLKSKECDEEIFTVLVSSADTLNNYNSISEEGYLAITISNRHHKTPKKSILELIMKMPHTIMVNENERTAIHNIVSTGSPLISDIDYVDLFDRLSNPDWDINSQDNLGRTALHIAVRFRNYEAVAGLLKAGADTNVLDLNEKLAFAYAFESSELANYQENDNYINIITRIFAIHVYRLQLSGLDVHPLNVTLKNYAFEKCASEINVDNVNDYFHRELIKAKSVKLGSYNLTLGHLLSETGAVTSYPTMTFVERHALQEFFESSHKYKLYSEYIDLACLLKLQYRKIVTRLLLMEPARESLCVATRIDLPLLCCEAVLRFLKNTDLRNLIAAMNIS